MEFWIINWITFILFCVVSVLQCNDPSDTVVCAVALLVEGIANGEIVVLSSVADSIFELPSSFGLTSSSFILYWL